MKNIGKWMKRNWAMFVNKIRSYKLGDWIDRFSAWANDKILGTEEDSDED